MNFAVLASGHGSNLQAIIDALKKKKIKAKLQLVVSDRREAPALKRAQKAGVEAHFVDPLQFQDREKFDRELIRLLEEKETELVVLAGFMRILGPHFIKAYQGKILNIHPSLLPAFRGANAILDAFEYGVKTTGVTVHFVEDKIDSGPVVLQEAVVVSPKETLESLEKKIHKVEHQLYPKAIDLFARGKMKVVGRRVVLK